MTQSNLEEKAGLSHNAVSRIECGMVSPRIDTIERIAQALDVSVERLQFQTPAPETGRTATKPDPSMEDVPISELIAALNQLPEPKRKQLLRTFLDLIRIAAGEPDA
jgi:transcriptional regulator with XRE-family HTH domain